MKLYRKKALQPMEPWTPECNMEGVSVAEVDTPEIGGMVAVSPSNPKDRWYVAKDFFNENYELAE